MKVAIINTPKKTSSSDVSDMNESEEFIKQIYEYLTSI